MQITLPFVQAHCLSMLKLAQKNFNKNPNSTNFSALTSAMLAHQQAAHIGRTQHGCSINLLLEKLEALPFGAWPETIVKFTTGLTIREVLTAA
jgi:hypothetical protein